MLSMAEGGQGSRARRDRGTREIELEKKKNKKRVKRHVARGQVAGGSIAGMLSTRRGAKIIIEG